MSKKKIARLASLDFDYSRLGIKRNHIALAEDGLHTNGRFGEYEWWYFDGKMNESICVDLRKHILISKEMENVMKKHLSEKYSKDNVELYWKKILHQYAVFLKDLPDFGGKKSRHNGPGGTYDCISLFAYYEVLNHEPSLEELYQMNCEVFLPEFKKMAGIVNANKSFLRRLLHLAFVMTAKTDEGRDVLLLNSQKATDI